MENKNPYLEITKIADKAYMDLTDDKMEIIFNVSLVGRTQSEKDAIYLHCGDKWNDLTWNEVMEILNDIYN